MLYDKWWKSPGDTCMRTEKGKESKANSLGVDNIGAILLLLLFLLFFLLLERGNVGYAYFRQPVTRSIFPSSAPSLLCFDSLSRDCLRSNLAGAVRSARNSTRQRVLHTIRTDEFFHLLKAELFLLLTRWSVRCTAVRAGVRRVDRDLRVLLQYQKEHAGGTGKCHDATPACTREDGSRRRRRSDERRTPSTGRFHGTDDPRSRGRTNSWTISRESWPREGTIRWQIAGKERLFSRRRTHAVHELRIA